MIYKHINLKNNTLKDMKRYLFFFLAATFFISCGDGMESGNVELDELKQQLAEKKEELMSLNKDIEDLEQKINKLDPASAKVGRLITADTTRLADFAHFVDVQATIQSDEVVNVSAEVPGRIVKLNIREGQYINAGALIAKLDTESLQRQMEEVETSLGLAETVFERQSRLWEKNIGSEIQYLEAKNNKERLEKNIASIETQLRKSNIYAPTSGVIDQLLMQEGEFANPGVPIAMLVNINRLKVVADVPEKYVGLVSKGEQVVISFPTLNEEIKARVTSVGRTISQGNRTFRVEANLTQRNENFKPNLLALLSIKDFEAKDAIQVPVEVVQQEASGKHFILALKESDKGLIASKQYVTIGRSYDNNVLIKEGLEPNIPYVLDGARGLANNELVRIK